MEDYSSPAFLGAVERGIGGFCFSSKGEGRSDGLGGGREFGEEGEGGSAEWEEVGEVDGDLEGVCAVGEGFLGDGVEEDVVEVSGGYFCIDISTIQVGRALDRPTTMRRGRVGD